MHLFAGLCGTEDFELWEEKQFSVVSIFDDEDVRDSFQRTDFKLMRTAAFSQKALWDTLTARAIHRFDREGVERYVCELSGDSGRCRLVFTSWKKFMAHQTHNKGDNHGIRSPLRVPVHESMCQLRQHICTPFHSAKSRRQFMDQRHLQNRPQSHDLGVGGDHTSNQLQPLRARIWKLANALRTCSPDPFAFPITDDSRESACPV